MDIEKMTGAQGPSPVQEQGITLRLEIQAKDGQ